MRELTERSKLDWNSQFGDELTGKSAISCPAEMALECYVFKQVFRVHCSNTLAKQPHCSCNYFDFVNILITNIETVSYSNHLIDLTLHPFLASRYLSL